MKLAITGILAFGIAAFACAGYMVVRGASHAASIALEWLEPAVRDSLPPGIDATEVEKRLHDAVALARDGRIEGSALRDTVLWLPGALLDGRLDAAEMDELSNRLDRVIEKPEPVGS